MDDALFARRALGVQAGRARPSSSSSTTGPPEPQSAKGGDKQEQQEYQPTPEEMLEMMKLLRDAGLADGPPDVPESIEVSLVFLPSLPPSTRNAEFN